MSGHRAREETTQVFSESGTRLAAEMFGMSLAAHRRVTARKLFERKTGCKAYPTVDPAPMTSATIPRDIQRQGARLSFRRSPVKGLAASATRSLVICRNRAS